MIEKKRKEPPIKPEITVCLVKEDGTENKIALTKDKARNDLGKNKEPDLQRRPHNAPARFRKWPTPGTRDARHKKEGNSKSALAYRGLTDPMGSAKMPRTLLVFVSIQALESSASQATVTRILAYDIGLPDLNVLLDGLDSSYQPLPIGTHEDAIQVISAHVGGNHFRELAFLCHGESGVLKIGQHDIDTNQINHRQGEMMAWNIDTVSLYSCNTGSDTNFIQTLSNIMQSHVFAASNKVGHENMGGNWILDVHAAPANPFNGSEKLWAHTLGAGDDLTLGNLAAVNSFISDPWAHSSDYNGHNNIIITPAVSLTQLSNIDSKRCKFN